nr:thiamine phosphate synthase [Nitrosomonas sp. HPC101]
MPIDSVNRTGVSGLYAITPDIEDTDQLCAMVYHVLAGGVSWLQYRNKVADSRLRFVQATKIHLLCRQFQVPLIVNDHLDLAVEIDAEGLHVGGRDISPTVARCHLGQDKIIGVSCYNQLDRAIEAEEAGADYVAFGAFYPSMTKTNAHQAPLDLLTAAKKKLGIPVVAIGGIDLDNAKVMIVRGCDAVAVSQALFGARDIQSAARHFSELFS